MSDDMRARLLMVISADALKTDDAVLLQFPWDFNGPGPMRVAAVEVAATHVIVTTVLAGRFQVPKGAQIGVLREVAV